MATAVPSVRHYASDSPGSIHRLLAEGMLRKVQIDGPRGVIYAAENHNHAAEILEQHVRSLIRADAQSAVFDSVRFLNTVIGKMSGVAAPGNRLAAITPDSPCGSGGRLQSHSHRADRLCQDSGCNAVCVRHPGLAGEREPSAF